MKNDWILDVLADLKTFALSNGLPVLAEQLEDTAIVAAAELASEGEGLPSDAKPEKEKSRRNTRGLGTGC
ncbi:hypothetical protein LZG00_05775 [Rhodobacteraceae bacterium LMO-12]|nr:hypothetical protein [Rhodobacteraceae bacterium LMO-JJ12]